jgi:adenine/guanine phosphoribosyltransferase-like PRPP-binding protein
VELLQKIDAEVTAAVFLIELASLGGRERLRVPVESLIAAD